MEAKNKSEIYIIEKFKQEFERVLRETEHKFEDLEHYVAFMQDLGFIVSNDHSKLAAKILLEDS
jgi:hypothetical protein